MTDAELDELCENPLTQDDERRVLAELRRAQALLRQIQWSDHPISVGECPECFERSDQGHAPDCELAAVLGDT